MTRFADSSTSSSSRRSSSSSSSSSSAAVVLAVGPIWSGKGTLATYGSGRDLAPALAKGTLET